MTIFFLILSIIGYTIVSGFVYYLLMETKLKTIFDFDEVAAFAFSAFWALTIPIGVLMVIGYATYKLLLKLKTNPNEHNH